MQITLRKLFILSGFTVLTASGCATNTGTGALAGGGLGAATGAVIGSATGHAGTGAAIGAGLGAAAGGLIGAGQDENDRKNADRVAQASAVQQQRAMSIHDVVYMSRQGIAEETIIAQIQSSGSYFQLTSADIVELRQQGVSERVVQTMLSTRRPVVRPRAVVYEEPVYVVSPPPVSFGVGYYWGHPYGHRRCW
jgi:hypothetical protein